jgi:hypothetical protein
MYMTFFKKLTKTSGIFVSQMMKSGEQYNNKNYCYVNGFMDLEDAENACKHANGLSLKTSKLFCQVPYSKKDYLEERYNRPQDYYFPSEDENVPESLTVEEPPSPQPPQQPKEKALEVRAQLNSEIITPEQQKPSGEVVLAEMAIVGTKEPLRQPKHLLLLER